MFPDSFSACYSGSSNDGKGSRDGLARATTNICGLTLIPLDQVVVPHFVEKEEGGAPWKEGAPPLSNPQMGYSGQEQTGLAVPDGRAVMLHVSPDFFGVRHVDRHLRRRARGDGLAVSVLGAIVVGKRL